jgi:hypothetical protein
MIFSPGEQTLERQKRKDHAMFKRSLIVSAVFLILGGVSQASGSPAAKAARDVLVNRFPSQPASIDARYQAYLSSHGLAADDAGVQVGARAAGIIEVRANDGSFPATPPPPFIGGNGSHLTGATS